MKAGDLVTLLETHVWVDRTVTRHYVLCVVQQVWDDGTLRVELKPPVVDVQFMLLNPERRAWLPGDLRDMPFEAFETALGLT